MVSSSQKDDFMNHTQAHEHQVAYKKYLHEKNVCPICIKVWKLLCDLTRYMKGYQNIPNTAADIKLFKCYMCRQICRREAGLYTQ